MHTAHSSNVNLVQLHINLLYENLHQFWNRYSNHIEQCSTYSLSLHAKLVIVTDLGSSSIPSLCV